MIEADVERFTVGVFQDLAWARKGVDALIQARFPIESLTILSKDNPDAAAFIQSALGVPAERLELARISAALARGPLVRALQGEAGDLAKLGLAGTMRRVGFQAHNGRIFDALAAR